MNPIKINNFQNLKLLEMCRTLFPEWKSHNITYLGFINDDTKCYSESDETFSIHWFEFCHEYLSPKVLGDTSLIFCGPNRPHPIDYLYEQFKKLK